MGELWDYYHSPWGRRFKSSRRDQKRGCWLAVPSLLGILKLICCDFNFLMLPLDREDTNNKSLSFQYDTYYFEEIE